MTDREAMKLALEALEEYCITRTITRPIASSDALRQALAQPEQEPVTHAVIAGVLFDFMGWLTSRPKRLVLSSVDEASPAVKVIEEFAIMRGLSLDDAKVKDWQDMTALRQALAQPEPPFQLTDAGADTNITRGLEPKGKGMVTLHQPEQEPLAWATFDGEGNYDFRSYENNETYRDKYLNCSDEKYAKKYANWVIPLYTAPPKREWVGLTDDDCIEAQKNSWNEYKNGKELKFDGFKLCKNIEQILKEKNNAV
jgi:hypothetical protein